MRRQRLLALAFAVAGLLSYNSSALAQDGDQAPARAGADSGRRMFDPVGRLLAERSELKLTDQQAAQLEAIRTRYLEHDRGRMEQLRHDRQARSAFRARMDSTRAEVMAVLTPEQEKQVDEMRKGWRHDRRGGHCGGRSGEHHRHGVVKPDSSSGT
jgi:Spy/CpxP family protein refolding chaperone